MPHRTAAPHTKDELRDRLRKLIAAECEIDVELLHPGTEISRLGVDSIHAVELTMAIEDEFDLEIPDHALDRLHTFEEVTEYLAGRLGV
jgi:acyl carrier protein